MARRRGLSITLGAALAAVILLAVAAASAQAATRARLVNARGGSDPVTLVVSAGGGDSTAGSSVTSVGREPVAYGEAGDFVDVPSGSVKLSLKDGGSKEAEATLTDGASYTVIALPKDAIKVVRNGTAKAGEARVRIVHAAPELGSPDVRLGKRTIAQELDFRAATKYLTVQPSSYDVAVAKPDAGDVLFERSVSLTAGTATTIVIAGSGGSPQRLIEVNDATVTPTAAPHTGLGGLARGDGTPWLLALLAALGAGALGGAAQLARGRRARP